MALIIAVVDEDARRALMGTPDNRVIWTLTFGYEFLL
jgi:hypothetical protein